MTGVGGKAGRPRLHAHIIEIIDIAIEQLFLDRQSITKAQLGREIARRCASQILTPPSRSVISRRLQRIGERELARRRKGPGAAEAETMRPGSLTVTRPNAVWQIDHSPADVILVDADSRAPIGWPWVILVIDVASRVVPGLFVSLDPPSVVSVGMAMQHAILRRMGPWPSEGFRRSGQPLACLSSFTLTTVRIFAADRLPARAAISASRPISAPSARPATADTLSA